jgi:hypothetical protein
MLEPGERGGEFGDRGGDTRRTYGPEVALGALEVGVALSLPKEDSVVEEWEARIGAERMGALVGGSGRWTAS